MRRLKAQVARAAGPVANARYIGRSASLTVTGLEVLCLKEGNLLRCGPMKVSVLASNNAFVMGRQSVEETQDATVR